jgi:hypothetical protein
MEAFGDTIIYFMLDESEEVDDNEVDYVSFQVKEVVPVAAWTSGTAHLCLPLSL